MLIYSCIDVIIMYTWHLVCYDLKHKLGSNLRYVIYPYILIYFLYLSWVIISPCNL